MSDKVKISVTVREEWPDGIQSESTRSQLIATDDLECFGVGQYLGNLLGPIAQEAVGNNDSEYYRFVRALMGSIPAYDGGEMQQAIVRFFEVFDKKYGAKE